MKLGNVIGILAVAGLAATGAALARDNSDGKTGVKAHSVAAVRKETAKHEKATVKGGQVAASVRHAKPQAPIVMGRSVSVHRKTKVHHVKMKSLELTDTPTQGDDGD